MSGILYGIGTGPGDAELMTLKAVKTVKACDMIAIPVSDKDFQTVLLKKTDKEDKYIQNCTAFQIVYENVPEMLEREILFVPMPMSKDKKVLKKVHDEAAEEIKKYLEQGRKIGFLTLGDPTIYSTYLYLHNRIVKAGYQAEIINGIPSFCAAAARLNTGLVENKEELHIIPASYGAEELLRYQGTRVLMKSGKKMGEVKEVLKRTEDTVMMVENCGMESEKIYKSEEEIPTESGYYSLIIVK